MRACYTCKRLGIQSGCESRFCDKCGGSVDLVPAPKITCRQCGEVRVLKCLHPYSPWPQTYCSCGCPCMPEHMLSEGCPRALDNLWETAARKEELGVGVESPLQDYLYRITPSCEDWSRQDELDVEDAAEDDRMLREVLATKVYKERDLANLKSQQAEIDELTQAAAVWERAENEKAALGNAVSAQPNHKGWRGVIDLEGKSDTSIGVVIQLGAVIIWDPADHLDRRVEIKFQLPVDPRLAHECLWVSKISGVHWGELCPGYTLMQPNVLVALLRRELEGVELYSKGIDLEQAFLQCSVLNGVPVNPLAFSVRDLAVPTTFNVYMIQRVLEGKEVWNLRRADLKRNGQPEGSWEFRRLFAKLNGYQKCGGQVMIPVHRPHRECAYFEEYMVISGLADSKVTTAFFQKYGFQF